MGKPNIENFKVYHAFNTRNTYVLCMKTVHSTFLDPPGFCCAPSPSAHQCCNESMPSDLMGMSPKPYVLKAVPLVHTPTVASEAESSPSSNRFDALHPTPKPSPGQHGCVRRGGCCRGAARALRGLLGCCPAEPTHCVRPGRSIAGAAPTGCPTTARCPANAPAGSSCPAQQRVARYESFSTRVRIYHLGVSAPGG